MKYYAFQIIEGVSMIGHTISLFPGRIQAYYWSDSGVTGREVTGFNSAL